MNKRKYNVSGSIVFLSVNEQVFRLQTTTGCPILKISENLNKYYFDYVLLTAFKKDHKKASKEPCLYRLAYFLLLYHYKILLPSILTV